LDEFIQVPDMNDHSYSKSLSGTVTIHVAQSSELEDAYDEVTSPYSDFMTLYDVDDVEATMDQVPGVIINWVTTDCNLPLETRLVDVEQEGAEQVFVYDLEVPMVQYTLPEYEDFCSPEVPKVEVFTDGPATRVYSEMDIEVPVDVVRWTEPTPPTGIVVKRESTGAMEIALYSGTVSDPVYVKAITKNTMVHFHMLDQHSTMAIEVGKTTRSSDVWKPTIREFRAKRGNSTLFLIYNKRENRWGAYDYEMKYQGSHRVTSSELATYHIGILAEHVCYLANPIVWATNKGTPGYFIADNMIRFDSKTVGGYALVGTTPGEAWSTTLTVMEKRHQTDFMCCATMLPGDVWNLMSTYISFVKNESALELAKTIIVTTSRNEKVDKRTVCVSAGEIINKVAPPLFGVPVMVIQPASNLMEYDEMEMYVPQIYQDAVLNPAGRLFQAYFSFVTFQKWLITVNNHVAAEGDHWMTLVRSSKWLTRLVTLICQAYDWGAIGVDLKQLCDDTLRLFEADMSEWMQANVEMPELIEYGSDGADFSSEDIEG